MSEPTKTIETTAAAAAAAAKPKVDRMWYPGRRETFAAKFLASLVAAGMPCDGGADQDAACSQAIGLADALITKLSLTE